MTLNDLMNLGPAKARIGSSADVANATHHAIELTREQVSREKADREEHKRSIEQLADQALALAEWKAKVVQAFMKVRDCEMSNYVEIPIEDWEELSNAIMEQLPREWQIDYQPW